MFTPIQPLHPAASPVLTNEVTARASQAETPARRAEAARQFEAMLLRQILGEAQKPLFRSSLVKDSTAAALYRDQITTQLADAVTEGGGVGLARALLEQWQSTPASTERRSASHEGAS